MSAGDVAPPAGFAPVDEFAAAWAEFGAPSGSRHAAPPVLAEFVPDSDDVTRAALVELIRIDMRNRWLRAGMGKRLVEYCDEFDGLTRDSLPVALVYEEFVVRRQAGQRVDPAAYLVEFPGHAAELEQLLNTEDGQTTVFAGEQTVLPGDETVIPDEATALSPATAVVDDATIATPTAAVEDWTLAVATAAAGADETTIARPTPAEALERLHTGESVDDFDLLNGLGSGAFARVFLARQRSMQRLVAVKVSADHGTEPQTLAQLDHDYIVRVFDQRVLPKEQLKLLYMQYLPGGTLLDVLRRVHTVPPEQRSGRLLLDAVDTAMEDKGEIRPTDSSVRNEIAGLSWPETVAWLGHRLALALDYADGRGVLHRDVKPANVLLTSEAVPKLADFNISFARNVSGTSAVAYFGGSLSYMSPEQLAAAHPQLASTAADLDTRSDIFSLGVVLWELLTGSKPFLDSRIGDAGDTTTLDGMLATRRDGVSSEAVSKLPADCPAALRRVLLTCLAPERTERWKSGSELAQQFELCLDAHARDLVDPPPRSWRMRLRPWLVPLITLAILVPNALASWYNIHLNQMLIIDELDPAVQPRFEATTLVVNATFFPLAGLLIVYLSRRVITVPRGLRRGRVYDAATLARTRHDTLLLADRAVMIVFSFWVVAGIAFPITLQIVAGNIPTGAYVHFLGSLMVCGAIALAYPFFLVAFYLVRCVYPMFLRRGEAGPDDARELRGLDKRSNFYLAVAASVPLLGVAGITFIAPTDIPKVIVAIRVLCVGGIVAFVLAYWLFRLLEADIRALERVVSTNPESATNNR